MTMVNQVKRKKRKMLHFPLFFTAFGQLAFSLPKRFDFYQIDSNKILYEMTVYFIKASWSILRLQLNNELFMHKNFLYKSWSISLEMTVINLTFITTNQDEGLHWIVCFAVGIDIC